MADDERPGGRLRVDAVAIERPPLFAFEQPRQRALHLVEDALGHRLVAHLALERDAAQGALDEQRQRRQQREREDQEQEAEAPHRSPRRKR